MAFNKTVAKCGSKAFTLNELLVVIAIIAILAGIIVPVLGSARGKAVDAQCASNAKEMGVAMHLYLADNKNTFPVHSYSPRVEATVTLGKYIYPNIVSDDKMLDRMSTDMACPVDKWNYGFNTYLSGVKALAVSKPARTVYLCDLTDGRWLDANVLTWKTTSLLKVVPKPHHGKVTILYVDGHVSQQKVSELMKGQVMNNDDITPVGDPSYDL